MESYAHYPPLPRGIVEFRAMKNRLALIVPVVATACASVGVPTIAGAQDSTTAVAASCPPNAALAYWRAWNGRSPTIWDNSYLEDQMRRLDPNWTPDAPIVSQLQGAQQDIDAVLRAASIEWCDWGMPIKEQGFDATLPHLAKMRVTCRVLTADARRLAAEGNVAAAAERLAALLLMTRHLRTDKTVYSVRSAQSMAVEFPLAEMRRLAELQLLDERSRAVLTASLEKMSGSDPCGMLDAIREEPVIIRDMVHRLCKGPTAAAVFFQKFAPQAKAEERAQSGIEQLDDAAIAAAAEQLLTAYLEVAANWESPDAVATIRSINDQKKAGDYGAVGKIAGSDLPHMRVIVFRFENIVKETVRVVNGGAPEIPTPGLIKRSPRPAAPAPPK